MEGMESMEDHMLNREWSFWYDAPHFHRSEKDKNDHFKWFNSIKKIYTVESIKKFWQVYNNIIPASQLKLCCSYILSQKDIKPVWYDLHNISGGYTSFTLCKQELEATSTSIDEIWSLFLVSVVGESLDFSDEISGIAIINNRYYYEIRVFYKKSNPEIHTSVLFELKMVVEESFENINEVEIEKIVFHENKQFL